MIVFTIWLTLQLAGAILLSFYFPGPALQLHILTELPLIILLVHYCWDSASIRYLLYIVYTVCVVLSVLVGSLGPWVLGGRYWNNVCIHEAINAHTGKYQVFDKCSSWHIAANVETLVRLPFQINIMLVMYGYFVTKDDEEIKAKRS